LALRVGSRLRLVSASSRNSPCVIDFAMLREAPRRLALERSPRFAESAAPAAICCFFDFAGMSDILRSAAALRGGPNNG